MDNSDPLVYILRSNRGMLRQVWFEDDTQGDEGPILVLRQTKFADNGDIAAKMLRLPRDEWRMLAGILEDAINNGSEVPHP